MFQTVFPSTIRSSKVHIQRQVFVIPLLLRASSLTLYVQFWAPDDGRKNRLKHVERLTEINKLRNVAFCWLYCANTLFYNNSTPTICKERPLIFLRSAFSWLIAQRVVVISYPEQRNSRLVRSGDLFSRIVHLIQFHSWWWPMLTAEICSRVE